MVKYELIPGQLVHEGSITPENLFLPKPCPEDVILLTHDADYLYNLKNLTLTDAEIRRIGFPLNDALVKRELVITQGTIDCCHFALEHGVALNVAGGTHHAFANRGEGFCLLNDMAVAANYLLHRQLAARILIIDLDVHQGNGTARLFAGDDRVFTFSMHGEKNYPFHKEKSSLDVALPEGMEDDAYLSLLQSHLSALFKLHRPDFVFYLSGVDVLHTDRYGKLKLTHEGCKSRDSLVLETCRSLNLPCTVAMGGGYSRDVRDIVEAHCNTFRVALSVFG